MKIRNGFVSNSSSSSFLVIGLHIEDEDLYSLLENKYYQHLEFYGGDEEGYVVGVYPQEFLEKAPLGEACDNVLEYMKGIMSKEDFENLMSDSNSEAKPVLIYDSYYS